MWINFFLKNDFFYKMKIILMEDWTEHKVYIMAYKISQIMKTLLLGSNYCSPSKKKKKRSNYWHIKGSANLMYAILWTNNFVTSLDFFKPWTVLLSLQQPETEVNLLICELPNPFSAIRFENLKLRYLKNNC